MAVPRTSQLQPNVDVNIILKNDQSSGKLTRGRISQILTRGDHPRGIKVRLTDGKIGRVQSLSTDTHPTSAAKPTSSAPMSSDTLSDPSDILAHRSSNAGRGATNAKASRQEDYSEDRTPLQSRSLADYIKVSAASKPALASVDDVQALLEKDFPKLDTALIAAILADHEDVDAARSVLALLS